MKIYMTRHGQISHDAKCMWSDVNLPCGEVLLSELGEEQARVLGRHLNKLGFHGAILTSPFLRTMITAQRIAEQTGSVIIPTVWMHELIWEEKMIREYEGLTLEQFAQKFPNVDPSATMEYPWWPKAVEDLDIVRRRVGRGLRKYLAEGTEDVLLVGHGASVMSALGEVGLLDWEEPYYIWNCGLSLYDTEAPEKNFANDVSHFPKEMVTSNKITGINLGFQPYVETLRRTKGTKLLHIGDTHSDYYEYYRTIIEQVKPDIIVHTGDTADEIKVGRMPEMREVYLEKIQTMLDMLRQADCKVYWVPGNNDLPEEIAKHAPFIQIVQPDTLMHMFGYDICLSHTREQITKQADIYLYGHGRRAASYEQERDMSGSHVLNLNAVWNSYACILPQKKIYTFEKPHR